MSRRVRTPQAGRGRTVAANLPAVVPSHRQTAPGAGVALLLQVTRVDQGRINEFGRLNARKYEIQDEIKDAKVRTPGGSVFFKR